MPTYDARVFLSVTVGRAREDINILHIFQSMKDLLCPESGSLVNYSVSLLLKCKNILDLFVLIISWGKKLFLIKGSQIFRNNCQVIYIFEQLISLTAFASTHIACRYSDQRETRRSKNIAIDLIVVFFFNCSSNNQTIHPRSIAIR